MLNLKTCLSFILPILILTGCASIESLDRQIQRAELWQSPSVSFPNNASKAERIRAIAIREHRAWGEPFITAQGHIAKYDHYESENARLTEGVRAWERVTAYWRDSGVLPRLDRSFNYQSCNKLDMSQNSSTNICRAFASDVAWSAAFISYVMAQAGIEDFYVSPRHYDYMYRAWQQKGSYHAKDPAQTAPKVGDMLCYVRGGSSLSSYEALTDHMANQFGGLPAHCDIVTQIHQSKAEAWLIGGNVLHAVMLRKLPIDDGGRFILPQYQGECSPQSELYCNLNQQNWLMLLQLQP